MAVTGCSYSHSQRPVLGASYRSALQLVRPNRWHSDQPTRFPQIAANSCSKFDRFSVFMAHAGRCLLTVVASSRTSSGCINSKLFITSNKSRACLQEPPGFEAGACSAAPSSRLTISAVSEFSAPWLGRASAPSGVAAIPPIGPATSRNGLSLHPSPIGTPGPSVGSAAKAPSR
jgi:hypothetical protein